MVTRNVFYRIFVAAIVSGFAADSRAQVPSGGLYTPVPSYNRTSHVVSTSVFHWYTPTTGQLSGPWLPLEGRPAWTGEPDWWEGQVKQMMMANIDILYVHLIPKFEQQRINLFQALNQLRYNGYDVPKVVPFLDPLITWDGLPNIDVATTSGKDEFTDQYIRFFNQYYSVNQDTYADDYLAKFDGKVILDSWHPHLNLDNLSSLSRSDIMARLVAEFGSNSVFSNDIYMVSTAFSPENYAFTDEKVPQFEVHEYARAPLFNGIRAAQVKPGYWDQNVRDPGFLLPRDGGTNYSNAWNTVNGASNVDHVYIESFNEYDEGSGIYAADPTNSPWINPNSGNTETDTWSNVDNPYEYIHTTAAGAAIFNDTPNHDAKILWHSFPDNMYMGETQQVTVIVRNTGDASWTAAAEYKFGDKADGAALFGAARYPLDDNEDEIPIYGGIFRGRPKIFQLTLVAPMTPGTYETHWGMLQEYVEWFGDDLAHTFTVTPAIVDLDNLLHTYDGSQKSASATTRPAGLVVDLTYDGSTNAPVNPGSYTVIGTINDATYQGSATNTLVIQTSAAYDAWKAEWFTEEEQTNATISGPEVYFDGDVFSNWEEYIAGTDPTDGQAFPTFDMQPTALDGYILNWASVSGRVYSIGWSSNLTQAFIPLQAGLLWPQSSYTDQIHQAETEGFYRMNVSLPTVVTTATIIAESSAGNSGDLFQGATVTTNSTLHPAGFVATDLFSRGMPSFAEDVVFADETGDPMSFVEFNVSSAVSLTNIVVGLANDHVPGDDNDGRTLDCIKVYASISPGSVQDNLIAEIAVDPEYTTAYGASQVRVKIDLDVSAKYFRFEFTEPRDHGVRIFEIDGFGK